MSFTVNIKIRDKDLTFETGKLAKQADGAVTVRYGDTIVLATAVSSNKISEGTDFLPLTADYREKTSAAGKFPGGYIKREARPTEKEILTARLIDRPIRPLFPEGYFYEVQVISDVISADGENNPDVLAINAASCALVVSDIPFLGPIGAVRIALINNEFVVNPTHMELENSLIDLVVSGTQQGITMIEGSVKGLPEETILKAVKEADKYIQEIIQLQVSFQKQAGKPKRNSALSTIDSELMNKIKSITKNELDKAIRIKEKAKRKESLALVFSKAKEEIKKDNPDMDEAILEPIFHKIEKQKVRDLILQEGIRLDGRGVDDIRKITSEIGLLPRTHGSALFTRGETQSLSITTLGTAADQQKTEGYAGESAKAFMLHYNFPPFSVGEVRPVRGPGRREIGHGALAERSLQSVLPDPSDFPYTIRIVSDILESNGSSSMATVCCGSLSLMDAGVPIREAVAGIAMGVIKDKDKYKILTDILGAEDACGDMDFKVAGTKTGITAVQLDVKLREGVTYEILEEGLKNAFKGRQFILDRMAETIKEPRKTVSTYAPKIQTICIPPDKIGAVIGTGGRIIKRIIEETGADIEINDDGKITVSSTAQDSITQAITSIKNLTEEVEIGKIYEGVVKTITDFGAFVEIRPGESGLLRVSEIADHFIKKVEDVLKIGDKIRVVVANVDNRGRINLSKKRADAESKGK